VFSTFCESHAADIPFHAVARLLRDVAGIAHVDDEIARQLVRAQVPGGSDEDLAATTFVGGLKHLPIRYLLR
jgi:adenylate cyclase